MSCSSFLICKRGLKNSDHSPLQILYARFFALSLAYIRQVLSKGKLFFVALLVLDFRIVAPS